MKRTFFVLACILPVAALLTYISLLGENGKIDDTVINLFEAFKSQNYTQAHQKYVALPEAEKQADQELSSDTYFLLELALLKKYGLLERDDYTVVLRKSHLWIPYLRDQAVSVDLLLKVKKDSVFEVIAEGAQVEFVNDLLVLERVNGLWKIKQINLTAPAIAPIFEDIKAQARLDQYIARSPHGFVLRAVAVDTRKITPVEKRVLKFVLRKGIHLVDSAGPIDGKSAAAGGKAD